jgi:hypothetical protein
MKLLNFFQRKDKTEELVAAVTAVTIRFSVKNLNYKSEEERLEILYFLIFQIDRILFNINPEKRNEIFDAFMKNILDFLAGDDIESFLYLKDSYNERAIIYTGCKNFIGEKGGFPGKGSAIFCLSYFLKRSSGKTNIKIEDIAHLLRGEGEVTKESIRAFYDIEELLKLSIEMSTIVIETNKLINSFKIKT